MAATVSSSVWGAKSKPGAWALDAEEHEDELRRELECAAAALPEPPSADFPTLAAAATTKTKKKKGQTLSLAEFTTYSAPKPKPYSAAANSQGLTADEILLLPTGPRERSAEEIERGSRGGFRNYGYDSGNSRPRVSERSGGFNDRSGGDDGFSRADEDDDWSKAKRYVGGGGANGVGGDRREKVGFFNSSRADEVDNWASNKSFAPSEARIGRRMGSDSFSSGGTDSDNWGSKKEERDVSGGQRFERERRGVGFESSGAASDSNNWLKKKDRNPMAVDSRRPKLNLQPRTTPISSSNEVKPKGSNPFEDARPREEVLKEKGQDWKEIDEKLEALKVKEGASGDAVAGSTRRVGFGTFKDDLMEKRSWRKWETPQTAATPASVDQVEKGDAEEAVEVAFEKPENGDEENN